MANSRTVLVAAIAAAAIAGGGILLYSASEPAPEASAVQQPGPAPVPSLKPVSAREAHSAILRRKPMMLVQMPDAGSEE